MFYFTVDELVTACKCGKALTVKGRSGKAKAAKKVKATDVNKNPDKLSSRSPHTCKICSNVLSSRGALVKHMVTHSEEKPFKCDQCDLQFNQNRDLKTHKMQKHTMQRPHVCGICGKGFVHKFYLMEHMTYHTGEKLFQCNYCGKTFPCQSSLSKHIKRHSTTRSFSCHLCSKAFTVKKDLTAHIKLGKRWFQKSKSCVSIIINNNI